jgi:hypothetical protein
MKKEVYALLKSGRDVLSKAKQLYINPPKQADAWKSSQMAAFNDSAGS